MKVLVFGSLNYDYVYSVDHIIAPGETESSSAVEMFLGGKGLNQSIASARAGADVYLGGQIGEDGDLFLKACKASGVNTKYLRRVSGKSGHTIIQLDKHAQNSIILYGGANRMQSKTHIDQVLSHFSSGDFLVVQNEINELPYLIDCAYAAGMQIAMNPSPFDAYLQEVDMQKISLFVLNEVEGSQLTHMHEKEDILACAKEMFPAADLLLTLGEEGSVCQTKNKRYEQNSFPCNVADTTGAGDTFTGYFIAGRANELPVNVALQHASMAASIACSRMGAVDGIPYRNEVDEALLQVTSH